VFGVKALERAKKYVGVKENPPGSNHGPLIDQWQRRTNGVTGYPWCAAFVWCMFDDVGKKVSIPGPALVENWVTHLPHVERPFKGDVVCYDWDSNGWSDHIGLVDKVLALRWKSGKFTGWVRTIEGNTSGGNDSNGGQVQVRWRWVNDKTVFIRL
jgi:hypothetical protein